MKNGRRLTLALERGGANGIFDISNNNISSYRKDITYRQKKIIAKPL
jgi:hypothetical protein